MTAPLVPLVLLSVLSCVSSTNELTNYGTSFYLGFIRQYAVLAGEPRILIGTNSTTPVNFFVTSNSSTLSLGAVTSSSSTTVPLSVSWLTTDSSYSERHKGVHISATAPIYVISSLYVTGGAAASHLVFPGHQLEVDKYEYIAVSYQTLGWPVWSLVLLVGNEDNTSITIVSQVTVEFPINPQDPTSNMFHLQAGFPHTVSLNRLQTLLFGSDGSSYINDMTGTKIISNKPLTVISGNECAFIPAGMDDCEPIAIQIPPVVTWGKDFLLPPVMGRTSGQLYKIVAAQGGTTVNLTCTNTTHQPATLSAVGSFVELNTSSSDYCHLESSSPVLVIQFSYGYETDGTGDPYMMLVPSTDQYSNKFFYRTPTGHDPDNDQQDHFLSVVATSADFSSSQIVYDGQPISFSWTTIRASDGSVVGYGCGFNISAGDHNVSHTDQSKMILGLAYGYVKYRAYGFPVGITHRFSSLVKFSQLNYTLTENQGVINISVLNTGMSQESVNVKLLIGNETSSGLPVASPGEDFQLPSAAMTFAAEETTKNVSLVIYDDVWVEFKEKFIIRLIPEDELLLGTHSTFYIIDNDSLQVGITSATTIISPNYALEICVSTTSGILQSGITVTVSLTAAIQAQEDAETLTVELDFSQHITTLCPQLKLLSLANEAELTNELTLTASLSASGAVQVTLSPSTTEIAVMGVMTSTMSASSMPQETSTTTAFPYVPQVTSIIAAFSSTSQVESTAAAFSSMPQETATTAAFPYMPQVTSIIAAFSSTPQVESTAAAFSSMPQETATTAAFSSAPQGTSTTAAFASMPQVKPPIVHFTHTSISFLSTPLRTMATGVTQSTNDSFNTLVAMGIGALLVCFITITISCTIIISCYCRRAKTQRTITNSMEPPMFPPVEHTYSGIPNPSFGIYDFIKAKDEPLPDLPDDEPYQVMKPAPSILANGAQTKTEHATSDVTQTMNFPG